LVIKRANATRLSLDSIAAAAYRDGMHALLIDRVDELLAQFGRAHGLRGLQLSEEGTCAFDHSSGLMVVVELGTDNKVLHWYARLCPVPADERERFYEQLLEKNLLALQTNGAAIGLDKRANEVVISYQASLDSLDVVRFANVMENFLETAMNIRESLKERFAESMDDSLLAVGDEDRAAFAIRV
jgi:hypothetical protein